MTKEKLARRIDHTRLGPATEGDIINLCQEAIRYNFRAVCVNPYWVSLCAEILKGHDILVAMVNDFPLGAGGSNIKFITAQYGQANGADEQDPVININAYKSYQRSRNKKKRENYLFNLTSEMWIKRWLPAKTIIETGHWNDRQIRELTKLVDESGAFCIKTSTGFEPKVKLTEKIRHIRIMKKTIDKIDSEMIIKAAGGIKTRADAEAVIRAGADIFGTSSGVPIMSEF